jgi:hypothetical protein
MKKEFLFTVCLEGEINEMLLHEQEKCSSERELLFREFIKDKSAIMELYKAWFLSELRYNEHYNEIKNSLDCKDDNDFLLPVVRRLPKKSCVFFIDIINSGCDEKYNVFERFFDQFSLLTFKRANFLEIEPGGTHEK